MIVPLDLETMSRDDLVAVLERLRFVREQLTVRVAQTIGENVELLGLVNDLQRENVALSERVAALENGEVHP